MSRFVLNEDMPTLDENDSATCEGKVTLEETSAALNKMKHVSAPDYDGITTEFMKFFWSKFGTLVTNSFIEATNNINKHRLQTSRKGIG